MPDSLSNISVLSSLSTSQLEELDHNGFVIFNLLSEEEISSISKNYYQQFSRDLSGTDFHSTMKFDEEDYKKEVDQYLKNTFSNKVEQLLPGYKILFSNFLLKKSGNNSEVGVHRDWTYTDESKDTSYNLWVTLDGLTEENGAFYVLPGSHKVPHGPRATPFDDLLRPHLHLIKSAAQKIISKKGTAVLYHSGLIHYSEKNLSGNDRLALGMVCLPEFAEVIHYHKIDAGKYKKFKIDTDFFYHFNQVDIPGKYGFDIIEDTKEEKSLRAWLVEKLKEKNAESEIVADYYNTTTEGYLKTYGRTIQAFRPKNENDLHRYVMKSAGLKSGMKVLDAGCGVAGPASYFAKWKNIDITGLTISEKQVEIANEYLKSKWLRGKVNVLHGDYHKMSNYATPEAFDRVLFLESLGHSHQPEVAVKQAFKMLKSGGAVYIKDFFPYEIEDLELAKKYKRVVSNINNAYAYHVLDLNQLISSLRRAGFDVGFIRKFNFKDDIKERAAFESMEKIDLFEEMQEFRVAEWLELYFVKP